MRLIAVGHQQERAISVLAEALLLPLLSHVLHATARSGSTAALAAIFPALATFLNQEHRVLSFKPCALLLLLQVWHALLGHTRLQKVMLPALLAQLNILERLQSLHALCAMRVGKA